jgi:plasmanylethanolamine desaturase
MPVAILALPALAVPAFAIPVQAAAVVLLADLVSGVVHWAEDAYARAETPVIGKLIANANIEHHAKPRAFLLRNWWQSSWDLVLVGMAVIATAYALGMLTWHVWLFAIVAANANQIHKWAHRNPKENGWLVTRLQKLRVLQTPRHHAKHHSGQKNSHYCAVTNFMNPMLERMRFWNALEWTLEKTVGLKRKPDPTVKRAPSTETK